MSTDSRMDSQGRANPSYTGPLWHSSRLNPDRTHQACWGDFLPDTKIAYYTESWKREPTEAELAWIAAGAPGHPDDFFVGPIDLENT